jgi:hypothetical protein
MPLPSGLQGDPCPSAIAATRAAVAPLGLTIARIHLEPGVFRCGAFWPGVGTPNVCLGPIVLPGTAMFGWVAFSGTAKVAAIQLSRTPSFDTTPSSPWRASLVAFDMPPAGWVMP